MLRLCRTDLLAIIKWVIQMRLFVAIKLEQNMCKAVGKVQDSFRSQRVSGNYVPPENLHITMAFIGEYSDPGAVLEAMEGLSFVPFKISMDSIGCFDDLWWAGFSDGSGLEKLARELRRTLGDAGIPYDKTRFKAHITFLRRARLSGRGLSDMGIRPCSMRVTGISLMRSTFGKNGMIYTELGRVDAQ